MKRKVEELKQNINKSVMIYIIGCCCCALVALVSIWFGYYIIRYHDEHELPVHLTVLSLGGGLLLWEMIKSFKIRAALPENFRQITELDFPALFDVVNEVTTTLNLSPIRKIYICPDATAAVFIQPQIFNLFCEPKKNLVFGMGFLTQMDDDEIRAVLFHEFGHYVQDEMKNSVSVYTIGQFSRSFVSIKKMRKEGVYERQIKLQLLIFTYFTINVCNYINKMYLRLSRHMEYEADDVAVEYVGASTLQRTLLHAACIRYNYEVVQWGIRQLNSHNIQVDNQYLALSFVNNYSHPMRNLLSDEVIKRVERLGELKSAKNVSTKTIQQFALLLTENKEQSQQLCPACQFAQWMKRGFAIYTQQRLFEMSVGLEIHLDKKKHDLPYWDSLYKLLLDDREIGVGNFIEGYTLKRKTSPGKHRLTVYAPSGIMSTPFDFDVEQNKSYHIEMNYIFHAKDGVYDVFVEKITSV